MSQRRNDDPRLRQRRSAIAHEAARRMAEDSSLELGQARRKAALQLGERDESMFPGSEEIREALRERQRLFQGQDPAPQLRRLREAALEAMGFFAALSPRLVGAVLDGTAGPLTPVCLHLHADDPDVLARLLLDQRIPAQQRTRRVRLEAGSSVDVPCWEFQADGIDFELVLLPLPALRHAPLEPVDGKPMARASASALERLLRS